MQPPERTSDYAVEIDQVARLFGSEVSPSNAAALLRIGNAAILAVTPRAGAIDSLQVSR
jgi:hypothetical protein